MSTGGGPLLGGGGFFGNMGPQGPYGAWPGCGCSGLLMMLGGFICAADKRFRIKRIVESEAVEGLLVQETRA